MAGAPPFPVKIRLATDEDRGFIRCSFARSYRFAHAPNLRAARSYKFDGPLLERADKWLDDPDCAVVIACNPDDEYQIFGWAIITENTVHYVYVRRDYRNLGVASLLLRPCDKRPLLVTHWVPLLDVIDKGRLQYVGADVKEPVRT
jgi:GNAT superfamily N-acetyltransferase